MLEDSPYPNFFEPKKKKNYSYEEIVSIMNGHLRYLLEHRLYLKKIELKNIDTADIQNYFLDVFNIRCEVNDQFYEQLLPKMLETVEERFKICKSLLTIAEIKNTEQAILGLCLALDHELNYCRLNKEVLKLNTPLLMRIYASFDSYDFFNFIRKSLVPHEPESLSTYLKIVKILKPNLNRSKKIDHLQYDIEINWQYTLRMIRIELKKIIQLKDAAHGHFIDREEFKKKHGEAEKALNELLDLIDKNKEYVKNKKDKNESTFQTIIRAVEDFSMIYPLYQKVVDHINYGREEYGQEDNFKKVYQQTQKMICDELEYYKKESEKINKKFLVIKKNLTPEEANKYANDLLLIRDKIAKSILQWPNEPASELFINKDIDAQLTDFEKTSEFLEAHLTTLKGEMEKQQQKLNEINKQAQEKLARKKQTEETAFKQQLLDIRKHRQESLLEEKKKSEAYKLEVMKQREEKAAAQKKIILPTNIEKKESTTRIYKNLEMEARLLSLSQNYMDLIRAILTLEKGIKFNEVRSLIIRQLGGQVEEIGNGSSHKRIKLDKYFIDIITHAGNDYDDDKIESKSIAVGGFYRPHGGVHNSKELSPFNVELVKKNLILAGITLEVLAEIEKTQVITNFQT